MEDTQWNRSSAGAVRYKGGKENGRHTVKPQFNWSSIKLRQCETDVGRVIGTV